MGESKRERRREIVSMCDCSLSITFFSVLLSGTSYDDERGRENSDRECDSESIDKKERDITNSIPTQNTL